jgi:transposase-like protein
MSNAFTAPHFQSHEAARERFEKLRWPDGPICPHCGTIGTAYKTKRPGLYRCASAECREDFTVTMNTVMERSKVPLNKWAMAFYLMSSSKKGISAHQLHRALGLSYQTAWFMCHRIRLAMADDNGTAGPLGGSGKIVEADEPYLGPVESPTPSAQRKGRPYTKRGKSGPSGKRAVVTLVERGGRVRSFHPGVADKETVIKITCENIRRETRLMTDESRL